MARRAILTALCLSVLVGFGGIEKGGGVGAVAGGSECNPNCVATESLYDDFSSDTGLWESYSQGSPRTCTVDTGAGELVISGSGVCHSIGGDPVVAGDGKGVYVLWQVATTAAPDSGAAVRLLESGVPDGGAYNYVLRCSSAFHVFRACTDGSSCQTIHNGGACNSGNGYVHALMVRGADAETEMCRWFWDSEDPNKPDFTVAIERLPEDWGPATECISSDNNIDLLVDYSICGGGTTCSTWNVGAPDSPGVGKGYSNTDMFVGWYAGSGGTRGVGDFAAGKIE